MPRHLFKLIGGHCGLAQQLLVVDIWLLLLELLYHKLGVTHVATRCPGS
jgi:hypothetical protein